MVLDNGTRGFIVYILDGLVKELKNVCVCVCVCVCACVFILMAISRTWCRMYYDKCCSVCVCVRACVCVCVCVRVLGLK